MYINCIEKRRLVYIQKRILEKGKKQLPRWALETHDVDDCWPVLAKLLELTHRDKKLRQAFNKLFEDRSYKIKNTHTWVHDIVNMVNKHDKAQAVRFSLARSVPFSVNTTHDPQEGPGATIHFLDGAWEGKV